MMGGAVARILQRIAGSESGRDRSILAEIGHLQIHSEPLAFMATSISSAKRLKCSCSLLNSSCLALSVARSRIRAASVASFRNFSRGLIVLHDQPRLSVFLTVIQNRPLPTSN